MSTHLKILIFLVILVGLGGLLSAIIFFNNNSPEGEAVTPATDEERVVTVTWDFEDADTRNLDGVWKTNVWLVLTDTNGDTERRLIDTVDGGCSVTESYQSDKIQCYYAGLGQEYIVRVKADVYTVERKYFEEGLPDVPATDYEWETVTQFSW